MPTNTSCMPLGRAAVLVAVWLSIASCTKQTPSPGSSAATPAASSPFVITATIQDIMQSEVDPSADALWESVATISSEKGIEEHRPRTDEEWAAVRRHAIILIEASNLLAMDGRRVAAEGKKIEDEDVPGILKAADIQKVIDSDRATFNAHARALHTAGLAVLAAIDARDAEALSMAGGPLDESCEACHLKYWYPDAPRAPE